MYAAGVNQLNVAAPTKDWLHLKVDVLVQGVSDGDNLIITEMKFTQSLQWMQIFQHANISVDVN